MIETTVRLNKDVKVDVPTDDVIEAISSMPPRARWNTAARILNALEFTKQEIEGIGSDAVELISKFLSKKADELAQATTDYEE